MKIKFIDVGQDKANWTAECPIEISEVYDWFYRQVKSHLMSRNLEFILNASADGSGTIFAGFHVVGHFKLIREGSEYEHTD